MSWRLRSEGQLNRRVIRKLIGLIAVLQAGADRGKQMPVLGKIVDHTDVEISGAAPKILIVEAGRDAAQDLDLYVLR